MMGSGLRAGGQREEAGGKPRPKSGLDCLICAEFGVAAELAGAPENAPYRTSIQQVDFLLFITLEP